MSPPRGGDSWKWSDTENQSNPLASANFQSLRISASGPPMWPMWIPNFMSSLPPAVAELRASIGWRRPGGRHRPRGARPRSYRAGAPDGGDRSAGRKRARAALTARGRPGRVSPAMAATDARAQPGQVQTVLGPVSPGDLGPTLMHEHLLCDIRPPSQRKPE